ncbi:ABC transporter ATP-binding protein [Collinsella sp. An2]|uniref:ABC transporter ATP-binding protein n=1 Tax=Collinsella sp. An2 TaxID=1965585 RepID=UPI000B3AA4B3|nr:ABC transporter ATP-binding protein [Collinsella sp. An2]OUP06133.1 hypothetical protein B5F33_10445 [Collinsella sp. An2]
MDAYINSDAASRSDFDGGVVLSKVSKTIKGKRVLDNVSVSFPKGGISGVRGHNGSGKTMMLRAIAGLIRIDSGSIRIFGEEYARGDVFPSSIGFLIEPLRLWDDLSGLQNLKLLASIRGNADEPAIRGALERVGLDPGDRRQVRSYSLGMHQRLCIAQAIMERPELILLDEPTNALDDDGKRLIRDLIVEEKDRGATIIVVSHDLSELDAVSDIQYQMTDGTIRER